MSASTERAFADRRNPLDAILYQAMPEDAPPSSSEDYLRAHTIGELSPRTTPIRLYDYDRSVSKMQL